MHKDKTKYYTFDDFSHPRDVKLTPGRDTRTFGKRQNGNPYLLKWSTYKNKPLIRIPYSVGGDGIGITSHETIHGIQIARGQIRPGGTSGTGWIGIHLGHEAQAYKMQYIMGKTLPTELDGNYDNITEDKIKLIRSSRGTLIYKDLDHSNN